MKTRAALAAAPKPPWMRAVAVPPGQPRTKPRALNVGLALASGTLITVYDAEDRPHPGQLREASARYVTASPLLACLQGRLAIVHAPLPAAPFALEYAGLFDLYNVASPACACRCRSAARQIISGRGLREIGGGMPGTLPRTRISG